MPLRLQSDYFWGLRRTDPRATQSKEVRQMMRMGWFLVAVLGIACGRSPFAPPAGTKVAVVPFSVSPGASVQAFDGDPSQVGQSLAEQIAEQLREDDRLDAVVVPNGVTPQGDLIVRGEITHINGGNTAVRVTAFAAGLVAWPFLFIGMAGRADLGSQGSVTRSDGTVVGVFSAEKHGDGWSQRRAIGNAVDSLGEEFGDMIKDGKYEGGHPGNDGYLAAPAATEPTARQHTVSDRLQELDQLHAKGLISDEEYAAQRRRLIGEL